MDTSLIDALMRTLTAAGSRRSLVAGLPAGFLASGIVRFAVDDAEAKKNGKRKKRRKNKNKHDKAKTRLDATCPGVGESGVRHPAADVRLAQTFAAIRSGPLVKVTLPLTVESDSAGDFVLRLSPIDSSGLPTNEELAATAADGDLPVDEVIEVEFDFEEPFSVVAGDAYALVLSRPAGEDFIWRGDEGLGCVGRASSSLDATSPFQFFAEEFDLNFTTFVHS